MNEVKLVIPNEWRDITIGVYQKYLGIQESAKSDKKRVLSSLALLCNVSDSTIKKIPYKDLIDATRYLCLNKLSVNHSGKYYIL